MVRSIPDSGVVGLGVNLEWDERRGAAVGDRLETPLGEIGFTITGLSPDEIPDKIRARIKRDTGELIVTFRYLTASVEPKIAVIPRGHIESKALVGVKSGLLYQLRVALPAGHTSPPQVAGAIDSLANESQFANRKRHFEIASEAFTDNAEALMAF